MQCSPGDSGTELMGKRCCDAGPEVCELLGRKTVKDGLARIVYESGSSRPVEGQQAAYCCRKLLARPMLLAGEEIEILDVLLSSAECLKPQAGQRTGDSESRTAIEDGRR